MGANCCGRDPNDRTDPYDPEQAEDGDLPAAKPSAPRGFVKKMSGIGNKELKFKRVFSQTHPGHIQDYYDIEKARLGEGAHGAVYRAVDRETKVAKAIKSINVPAIEDLNRFYEEIAMHQVMDHPNVCRLQEVFRDGRKIYLVMELCTGGSLWDRVAEVKVDHDEHAAAAHMLQILGAIEHIHAHDVVHCDIKPDNLLLLSRAHDAPIKVIDFGFATKHVRGSRDALTKYQGSVLYVAPQVLSGSYDEKCDVWSCGVVMYLLLCGYPPFRGRDDQTTLDLVEEGRFNFPAKDWEGVSRAGKDLIRGMLAYDPDKRLSAEACLEHTWIRDHAARDMGVVANNLGSRLKKFRACSNLKKLALTVIAQELSDEDVLNLRKTFMTLDSNGDGFLTAIEIREGMVAHNVAIPESLEEILDTVDTDASGRIEYTEFIAATISKKQYLKREAMWAAFRKFDLNGDGSITKQELRTMLEAPDDDKCLDSDTVDKLIGDIDLNGDGQIQFDEFCAAMQVKIK